MEGDFVPTTPERWNKITCVYYDGDMASRCIMLAANQSLEDINRAQNIDLIQQYRDLLHVETMPGWYRIFN